MTRRMFTTWARMDLSDVPHGRRILASVTIDSIGSGLMLAFVPLYFVTRAHLSAGELGALMTVGALLALPAGTLTSSMVAKLGAARSIRLINVGRAIAGALALAAVTREIALVALFLAAWGENAFWAANGTFVADVTGDLRQRWYAMERSIRNAAAGLGALVGGLAVTLTSTSALVAIMALNAFSYFAAAALLLGVTTAARAATKSRGRRLYPYRNPQLILILLITIALVVPMLALAPLLMLTLSEQARWGALLTGGLVGINVVILVIWQPSFTARSERVSRTRLLGTCGAAVAVAGLCMAVGMRYHGWALALCAVAAILLVTVCELGTNASLYETVVTIAPSDELPHYMAAYQLAWALCSVVWPAVLLPMLALGSAAPWFAVAALGGTASALAVFLQARPAGEPAHDDVRVRSDVEAPAAAAGEPAT